MFKTNLFDNHMLTLNIILCLFFKFVTVLVGKIQKRDEDYLALEKQKEQIEDQLRKLQDEQPLALLESKFLFLLVTRGLFTYNVFICYCISEMKEHILDLKFVMNAASSNNNRSLLLNTPSSSGSPTSVTASPSSDSVASSSSAVIRMGMYKISFQNYFTRF